MWKVVNEKQLVQCQLSILECRNNEFEPFRRVQALHLTLRYGAEVNLQHHWHLPTGRSDAQDQLHLIGDRPDLSIP
jgi:hypothetical protein